MSCLLKSNQLQLNKLRNEQKNPQSGEIYLKWSRAGDSMIQLLLIFINIMTCVSSMFDENTHTPAGKV